MRKFFGVMAALFIVAGPAASAFAEGKFDHIITVAEVESIAGLTGVMQVPREPLNKFRNGDLNFVLKDEQPVLMIQFRPVLVFDTNVYENLKSDSGYFKAPVQGIGEEAFTSPAFAPQFSINFRKGKYFAVVTTHVDPRDKTKTVLKMDHLIALAKLIVSRM